MQVWIPIVLCFIAGIGLVALEVFLPGFGLPGISGIAFLTACIALTWFNVNGLAVAAIVISMALKSAAKGRLSKSNIILNETESSEAGYNAVEEMDVFLGRVGVATTVLRPTGMADFDGVRLNVVTEGEFISAQTAVRITKVDGPRIVVRKA